MARSNLIVWSVLAAVLGGGWMVYADRSKEAATAEALAAVESIDSRWQDSMRLLQQTPRIALPAQIAIAQELAQEARGLPLTGCPDTARAHLVRSIDAGVSAYLAFLGQQGGTLPALGEASSQRAQMLSELGVCRGEAPIDFSELDM
jgi:alkanesulfonate monooxygenase SsuD/methylene tetrahydromethanopterin reductase-like flavin-dependent oxidoreductase (luciferase family)